MLRCRWITRSISLPHVPINVLSFMAAPLNFQVEKMRCWDFLRPTDICFSILWLVEIGRFVQLALSNLSLSSAEDLQFRAQFRNKNWLNSSSLIQISSVKPGTSTFLTGLKKFINCNKKSRSTGKRNKTIIPRQNWLLYICYPNQLDRIIHLTQKSLTSKPLGSFTPRVKKIQLDVLW